MALEAQLRADIISAGGPVDWALPYWNYYAEAKMPQEFAVKVLPAGFPAGLAGQPNPLYVGDRFGPDGDGRIYVPSGAITLKCLSETVYTDKFGGGATAFAHFGNLTGQLENDPHNFMHVIIGGFEGTSWTDPNASGLKEGLMSDPDLAALDPIFYIHHCMIDALWADWNVVLKRANPTTPGWLNGSVPEFSMPWPQSPPWKYKPSDVTDIVQLNYTYDFLANPSTAVVPFKAISEDPAMSLMESRMKRLGAASPRSEAARVFIPMAQGMEMLGASATDLVFEHGGIRAPVTLDTAVQRKLSTSLNLESLSTVPDRVYLKIEGVTGTAGAIALDVFVDLPVDARPAERDRIRVGRIGLFGLRQASDKKGQHGGAGLSFTLDITDIMDDLHLQGALSDHMIQVSLLPLQPVSGSAPVRVGRFSVHREMF